MRSWLAVIVALALAPSPVLGAEAKCSLSEHDCLVQMGKLQGRPWLGIEVDRDSVTGERVILGVYPGGPADVAGIKVGDTLDRIGGMDPGDWVAGKAGWKDATLTVRRGDTTHDLAVKPGIVPEAYLARMIGKHMLEGHLAYVTQENGESH